MEEGRIRSDENISRSIVFNSTVASCLGDFPQGQSTLLLINSLALHCWGSLRSIPGLTCHYPSTHLRRLVRMGSDHRVSSCTKPEDMLTRTYLNLEEDGLRVTLTFIYSLCPATGNRREKNHGGYTGRLPEDSYGWGQDTWSLSSMTSPILSPHPGLLSCCSR